MSEHRFLSNRHPSVVSLDGKLYPTVEHAFQAARGDDPVLRRMIREATSTTTALQLGRKQHQSPDWDDRKLAVMEDLLRQKFANGALMAKLLATAPEPLIHTPTWSDSFWGVSDGHGENHLGRLLMKIRDEHLA